MPKLGSLPAAGEELGWASLGELGRAGESIKLGAITIEEYSN